MPDLIKKNFDSSDDSMHPSKRISVDVLEINSSKFRRVTAQPGWKWSVDLKPVVKTNSCQEDHLLYMITGKMVVRMDNGRELEYGPGDLAAIPPGHDGWGVGEEPTIWLEIPH
jgi:hypothetical protein